MKLTHVTANVKMRFVTLGRMKGSLFFMFLFPIMLMLILGALYGNQGDTSLDILVQDRDNTQLSHNFSVMLGHVKGVNVQKIGANVDADRYMKDHQSNFLVVIPKGYKDAVAARMSDNPDATVNLTLKYDPSQPGASLKLSVVHEVLQEVNKGLSGAKDTIRAEPQSIVATKFSYIDFVVPGLIGMTVMTSVVNSTIQSSNEFRQKGIIRKLATTPLTQSEWILSTTTYQFATALMSSALILVVGRLLFGATLDLNLFVPAMIILAAFAFAGLGMLVARAVSDAQSGSAVANIICFPMMFLSGTFVPLDTMPAYLQAIARIFPLYYINEGLRDAMIISNFGLAALNGLVMLVFALVVFVLGVRLSTWKQD
jgi:ABC-2 type transport system permease protein